MPEVLAQSRALFAPVRSGHMDWLERAACRGIPMVDGYSIFFPKITKSPGRPPKSHTGAPNAEFYEEAIALCDRCPVIHDCREEYTREPIPRDGMFFGKTPQQRTRLQTRIRKYNSTQRND